MKDKIKFTEKFGTCSKDCYGACVFTGEWNDQALEKKLLQAKPRGDHPFTNGFFLYQIQSERKVIISLSAIKNGINTGGS